MSTIIKVRCTDQVLTFENTPVIASGGLLEDYVEFAFCSKWDGLVKTAVFWRSEDEVYHVLLDETDRCEIPREVLATEGVVFFGVFGVNDEGKQRTSEVLRYIIEKGAITEGTKPTDPTPDIYTQILAEFLRFENEITADLADHKTTMTQAWTEHQEAMTQQQTNFETAMTERQTTYEAEMNEAWEAFKAGSDFVLKTDYDEDQEEQAQAMTALEGKVDEVERTVNDQLGPLALSPAGTGTLYIYCKDEAGSSVSGCVVQIGDELAVTDTNGAVKYFLVPGTYSVSIHSPIDYGADVQTLSATVTLSGTVSLEVTIKDSLNGATELRVINSISGVAFSDRVTSADVFVVGGGGSGGISYYHKNGCAATGGAGGKTEMATDIDVKKVLTLTVGAGGDRVTGVSVSAKTAAGKSGGTTLVSDILGNIILSAPGGDGGGYISTDYPNCDGASGGSGSGGAYGYQSSGGVNGVYIFVGDSGEDGGDGEDSGYGSSGVLGLGGDGQGKTTRLWGEADGELFASAGASAARTSGSNDDTYRKAGLPGLGGGTAFVGQTAAGESFSAGDASTLGSGGGAFAVRMSSATTCNVSSGAGMHGLIAFRWRVSA